MNAQSKLRSNGEDTKRMIWHFCHKASSQSRPHASIIWKETINGSIPTQKAMRIWHNFMNMSHNYFSEFSIREDGISMNKAGHVQRKSVYILMPSSHLACDGSTSVVNEHVIVMTRNRDRRMQIRHKSIFRKTLARALSQPPRNYTQTLCEIVLRPKPDSQPWLKMVAPFEKW